ncbi:MAG: hypothetical protein ACTSRZ_18055 [Promethearchaeota archaeon]
MDFSFEEELEIELFLHEFRKFQWFIEEFHMQFPRGLRYTEDDRIKAQHLFNLIIDQTYIFDLPFLEYVVDSLNRLKNQYKDLLI